MNPQNVYGASGTSWEQRRATHLLPVVLAVLMRDASQVFKRIENRNNYSPIISRWGNGQECNEAWRQVLLKVTYYRFESCPGHNKSGG